MRMGASKNFNNPGQLNAFEQFKDVQVITKEKPNEIGKEQSAEDTDILDLVKKLGEEGYPIEASKLKKMQDGIYVERLGKYFTPENWKREVDLDREYKEKEPDYYKKGNW